MFIRPIKVKSNNAIKTSEKKHILKEILNQYPLIDEQILSEYHIKDSEISLSKITTHNSLDVLVYLFNKIPLFFRIDKEEELIPTVYFLWKFPDILPKFFSHNEVAEKLLKGADLMLPGVIVSEPVTLKTFKHIKKNDLISFCTIQNQVPTGIGRACLSGEDMYMSAMRGKCLNMVHLYGDNLWALGDTSIKPPVLQSKEDTKASSNTNDSQNKEELANENDADNKSTTTKESDNNEDVEKEEELSDSIDHETILNESFFSAIKFKQNEYKLPINLSAFVKIMQGCCPAGCQFDLKETKYKKMSVYLKEMELCGILKIKELQKGVLSITDIKKDHETVTHFKKPEWLQLSEDKCQYEIVELFKIDTKFSEILKSSKEELIDASAVKQNLMIYIKEKNLISQENKKFIQLDDLLKKLFVKNKDNETNQMSFEDLFKVVFGKLSSFHQIKQIFVDNTDNNKILVTKKGKFEPIEFKLENRAGNKKVTCIHNISSFEIDPNLIANRIKKELGCSVSINQPDNAKSSTHNNVIIIVQGNQIYQVSELLKNEFGIQLKYMKGIELGIKAKKN